MKHDKSGIAKKQVFPRSPGVAKFSAFPFSRGAGSISLHIFRTAFFSNVV
jgi:hypothetical protein